MPTAINETNEYPPEITAPEPGDDRTAASVEGPFRQLANRTHYLRALLEAYDEAAHTWSALQHFTSGFISNNFGVQGEVMYCGADGAVQARDRTVRLPFSAFVPLQAPNGAPGWYPDIIPRDPLGGNQADKYVWRPAYINVPLVAQLSLPSGSVFKSVTVEMRGDPGLNAVFSVTAGLYSGKGHHTASPMVSANYATTDIYQTLAVNSVPVVGAERVGHISISVAFVGIPTSTYVEHVWATFGDPGPRNF